MGAMVSSGPLSASSLTRWLQHRESQAWLNTLLRTRSTPLLDALAEAVSDGRHTARELQQLVLESPGSVSVHPRSARAAAALATVWATIGDAVSLPAGHALLGAVLAGVGHDALTTDQRHIFAQAAYHVGDLDGASRALAEFPDLERDARWSLRTDLLHPAVGRGSREEWLTELSAPFVAADLPGVTVAPDAEFPFDGLSAVPGEGVDGPLVSVIMPCFRPDDGLLTSVRSILAQTHGNLEILLVDDASGPEYAELFDRCAALDPRVRLIRQPVNGGTYVARNTALRQARGELVTIQDADDWSHPNRLADQVQLLEGTRGLGASRSDAIRATDDLVLQWVGFLPRRRNASSLMFRRSVVDRIGPFDTVRKGADSEYIERVRHLAGPVADTGTPLAITRLRLGTLSRSDFAYGRMAPDRVLYQSAYRAWHRGLTASSTPPAGVGREDGSRPFATPASFRRPRSAAVAPREVDVLLVLDPSSGPTAGTALELLQGWTAHRVGVLFLEDTLFPRTRQPLPTRPLMTAVNEGLAELVGPGDQVRAAVTVVLSPNVLATPPDPLPPVSTDSLVAVAPVTSTRDGFVDVLGAQDGARSWFGRRPTWCALDETAQDEWQAAGRPLPVLADLLDESLRGR